MPSRPIRGKRAHPARESHPWRFRPKWNSSCLCGSGRKYRSCCRPRLPGTSLGHKSRDAIRENNLPKALLYCRADITQYTIWHKSHTDPAMRMGNSKIGPLLDIDIRALADTVDLLCQIYLRVGRQEELPAVLERLRCNILDARWQRKISYFLTLSALWPGWNREAGRLEFKKLGAITPDEDDVEILQLYIDLYAEQISFATRIKLYDRILALTEKMSDRLQYQGAKAFSYLLIGDVESAETELAEVVECCRKQGAIEELTQYGRLKLSNCLELLAVIRRDQNLFDEAIELLKGLLEEDGLTSDGRADLYRQLGDCLRYAGSWGEAEIAYRKALENIPAPIIEVFLSEALLRQGKGNDAITLIDRIVTTGMERPEYEDYVFTFAAIAVETGERNRLEKAKSLLENLNIVEPYFNNRRLELLVHVQATLKSGRSVSIIEATRKLLKGMMRGAGRYLVLQPNLFGLGLNVNSIIADLAKEQHVEQELVGEKPATRKRDD
jgi:tetratricopeptide (TPR) repeat protein